MDFLIPRSWPKWPCFCCALAAHSIIHLPVPGKCNLSMHPPFSYMHAQQIQQHIYLWRHFIGLIPRIHSNIGIIHHSLLQETFFILHLKQGEKSDKLTACHSSPSVVDFLACPLVAGCCQGLWIAPERFSPCSTGVSMGMTTIIFPNSWYPISLLLWTGQEVNLNKSTVPPPTCWIALENILIPHKMLWSSDEPNHNKFCFAP